VSAPDLVSAYSATNSGNVDLIARRSIDGRGRQLLRRSVVLTPGADRMTKLKLAASTKTSEMRHMRFVLTVSPRAGLALTCIEPYHG
jgi:hypothetical protein